MQLKEVATLQVLGVATLQWEGGCHPFWGGLSTVTQSQQQVTLVLQTSGTNP